MVEQKLDRRVRKTRKQLKNGLLDLMQEHPINEITVKMLVEYVDINRSTFYLHYQDIYAMLEEIEQEIYDDIVTVVDTHLEKKKDQTDIEQQTFSFLEELFTIAKRNSKLCLCLLGPNGDISFLRKMEDFIELHCHLELEEIIQHQDHVEYTLNFFKTGCMGLLISWMKNDFKETPEEMARLVFTIGKSIVSSFMIPE